MTLSPTKFTWLLLLFVLFSATVTGQRIYSPGYIIQTGDTLHGLLSYSGFGKESKQLFFKGTETATVKIYAPPDIYGFFYEGELFESAIVNTEVSRFEMGVVEAGAELQFEEDTVFLTQMVKGVKSLYYFANRIGKDQFYIKIDSEFDLLVYKKYMREVNGKKSTFENKKYIGQLNIYMNDCPEVTKDLKYLKYSKSSLVKLFWQYNDCKGYTPEVTIGRKMSRFEFGVKAGLNFTSFTINKKPFRALLNLDDAKTTFPVLGIFLNTYLQSNRRNLSFYNELYYTQFYATGHMEHYLSESYYTLSNSKIDYEGVKLMTALRYAIPVGAFNIYLNAGVSLPIYILGANYTTHNIVFYTSSQQRVIAAIPDFKIANIAAIGGFGATYKKYSFDLRFEKRGEYTYNDEYSVDMSMLYFMAGYRF